MSDRHNQPQQQSRGCYTIEPHPFLDGLVSPICVTSTSRDPHLLYVAEQHGVVWRYNVGLPNAKRVLFLDISNWMVKLHPKYDERGLIGFCLHPDFGVAGSPHAQTFFVFYSTNNVPSTTVVPSVTDPAPPTERKAREPSYYNCLSAFTALWPDGTADVRSEVVLMAIHKNHDIHNGGRIAFGPDRYLYLGLGDGGPQQDPWFKAQNLRTWYGKLLRIDVSQVETQRRYIIPSSNPWANGKDALPEIYAYGFRNPWGIAWDRRRNLLLADVGLDTYEEINIVVPGGNYGWPYMEGNTVTPWIEKQLQNPEKKKHLPSNLRPPCYQYNTPDPEGAIIGGVTTPSLADPRQSWYVFGDLSGKLGILEIDAFAGVCKEITSYQFPSNLAKSPGKSPKPTYVKSFGRGGDGKIYVLTSRELGPKNLTGEVHVVLIRNTCTAI